MNVEQNDYYTFTCMRKCSSEDCYLIVRRLTPSDIPSEPGKKFCPYNSDDADWELTDRRTE